MEREALLLQELKKGLSGWLDVIRRSTGAREVEVHVGKDGTLSIVGVWYVGTAVTRREHKKTFQEKDLFGSSLSLAPAGRRLVKRPCDCAKEYIREILQERGVI